MKDLFSFILEDEKVEVAMNGRKKEVSKKELENAEGKKARANLSKGRWGIDEPTDNEAAEPLPPKEEMSRNMKMIASKMAGKEPFFVQGKAGWGKTQIIKKIAKQFGRSIITVYLDKAMATDLGGIPSNKENEYGDFYTQYALPPWAAVMAENPDQKFLLFFDEMNQATPDVLNALMPIVLENEICGLKFKNFIVGAAGNFSEENEGGLSDLSVPLAQRFKPLIIWDAGTDEEWNEVFKYLHKKWDDVLSKEFIDLIQENAKLFESPRIVEHKIFKYIDEVKKDEAGKGFAFVDASLFYERLMDCVDKEFKNNRSTEKIIQEIAEKCEEELQGTDKNAGRQGSTRMNMSMMDPELKEQIDGWLKAGYVLLNTGKNGDQEQWGVSLENVADFIDFEENGINKEIFDNYIENLKKKGIKVKYKKNSEFPKDFKNVD